jgi:D-glycero-alpha-D-manno-heptose 1-phosphate guanylyltransferase
VYYSIEKAPLGTGGSVIEAVKNFHLKDPFILINGDTYFEVDLEEIHNFSIKKRADWCFSLFDSNDKFRYLSLGIKSNGSIVFPSTMIQDSNNQTSVKNESLTNHMCANGGVYWINPRVFDSFLNEPIHNKSLENDIFHRGIKLGQNFYGLRFTGTFIDIGLPNDYNQAQIMDCFRTN